ncbi:MAG: RluA family pseudouridine synthase [Myxococcaceae bacterium]
MNEGFDYREQIGAASDGKPVLDHLAARYRHSTAAVWSERLLRGEVLLDGAPAGGETALRRGQWLVWRRPGWVEPEAPLDFEVLFDDGDLLAVAKPRGLPTVPGGGYLTHSLLWQVRKLDADAAPMHRLDRATSGLVLFARSARARTGVGEAWRRGEVFKSYRALVVGSPVEDAFEVDLAIGEVQRPGSPPVSGADPAGKRAHSKVAVVERRGDRTLVEVEITTGRTHQIRIHLAAAGYPLWGDPLYGPGGAPVGSALAGEGGFLLHARWLSLPHPLSGARLEIDCPPPPDLR